MSDKSDGKLTFGNIYEMQEEEVNIDLEYLILATDGLWDVVRNEVSPWIPASNNQLWQSVGSVVEVTITVQYHQATGIILEGCSVLSELDQSLHARPP